MDTLNDAEGLAQSLGAVPRHGASLVWTAFALERKARMIHTLYGSVHDRAVATRLDDLSDRACAAACQLHTDALSILFILFTLFARRSLLRSAVLFAQTACLMREEDPASIPALDPLWRSAAYALSDIFG